MKLPAMDFIAEDQKRKIAKEIADKALDEYEYKGKTIRQWADLIANNQEVDHIFQLEKEIAKRDELLAIMGIRIPEDGDPHDSPGQ